MLNQLLDPQFYTALFLKAREWTMINIFVMDNFLQLSLQILILLAARGAGEIAGRWVRHLFKGQLSGFKVFQHRVVSNLSNKIAHYLPLLFSIFFLWLGILILQNTDFKTFLMTLVLNLSIAWVVIQIAASIILDRLWRRIIASLAWLGAVLNILNLTDETLQLLGQIGFTIGEIHLNLLSILKAAVLLALLLKLVRWISDQTEKSLANLSELTPSSRLMIAKTVHLTLLFVAALTALNSVGIDLTALAVFSGAVGVGVGFGLQKVVANFISGLILLSDKSVKPGDVIEIDSIYGWVRQMGGRCVSLVTRDEKEYLIPNEDLITRHVINWSYSSKQIRLKADIGISYKADVHEAIRLIVGSVKGIDRILKDPAPNCLLTGFGDSSVNLKLNFWISDPQNGVANITSEVLLKIWDTLKENHIEIPFPQRDVHLDLPEGIKIDTTQVNSPK
jgi:small-conductance mechanosensitive channel